MSKSQCYKLRHSPACEGQDPNWRSASIIDQCYHTTDNKTAKFDYKKFEKYLVKSYIVWYFKMSNKTIHIMQTYKLATFFCKFFSQSLNPNLFIWFSSSFSMVQKCVQIIISSARSLLMTSIMISTFIICSVHLNKQRRRYTLEREKNNITPTIRMLYTRSVL